MRELLKSIANRSSLIDSLLDGLVYVRGLRGTQVGIIVYHRVGEKEGFPFLSPIPLREFEKQIEYLSKTFMVMPLDILVEHVLEKKTLPKRVVAITFDDGYRDNYRHAYPILKRYGLSATFFLATDYINKGVLFWWDQAGYVLQQTRLRNLEMHGVGTYSLRTDAERRRATLRIIETLKGLPDGRKDLLLEDLARVASVQVPSDLGKEFILSWDEIRRMSSNGMDFGAHSHTHPILTRIPLLAAREEIIRSKHHIEEQIGRRITSFAYPNGMPGDFNEDIKKIVRESGFERAFAVCPMGAMSPTMDRYQISRFLAPMEGLCKIKFLLSGLHPAWGLHLRRPRENTRF